VWLVLVLVHLIPDIYKWTTEFVVSIESLTWRRKVDLIPFTIKGLEQGWLAQCQFNVTG